jgi:small-conductance mechanosensitive channel
MNMEHIQERLSAAFSQYIGGMVDALPALLTGAVVLLIGWLFAKVVRAIVLRTSGKTLDKVAESSGMSSVLAKLGGATLSKLVAGLLYALILLVFIMASADLMGLALVTRALESFMAYLPTLLTALTIFVLGLWMGDKVGQLVLTVTESAGLSSGRSIARVLGGVIVLFTSITALNMAGVDTELITSNIQIVLAGILLAFGLAYGFAARDVLTNILSSFYGKDRFKPGMTIRIGQDEGVIKRIDSISLTMDVSGKEVLIPTSKLVTERIEILSDPGAEARP